MYVQVTEKISGSEGKILPMAKSLKGVSDRLRKMLPATLGHNSFLFLVFFKKNACIKKIPSYIFINEVYISETSFQHLIFLLALV